MGKGLPSLNLSGIALVGRAWTTPESAVVDRHAGVGPGDSTVGALGNGVGTVREGC